MVAIINPFVTTREQLALAGLQTIPDPLIKLRWAESESIPSNQLNTRYSPNMRTVMVGKWTVWTLDTGTVGHIQESRINDELTVQHRQYRHTHCTQVDTNIWESKQKYLSGFEIVNIMLAMHTNSTLGKYPHVPPFQLLQLRENWKLIRKWLKSRQKKLNRGKVVVCAVIQSHIFTVERIHSTVWLWQLSNWHFSNEGDRRTGDENCWC